MKTGVVVAAFMLVFGPDVTTGFSTTVVRLGGGHRRSETSARCYGNRPSMLFGWGNPKEESVSGAKVDTKISVGNGRPMAGGKVVGGKKTTISTTTSWTGPAVERRKRYLAKMEMEKEQKKNKVGIFTPKQMEAFKRARQEVPSGVGRPYWEKIAARVPGQTAITCKKMAETMLNRKAIGTQAGFFGSYVEVDEVSDYVDPNADVMGKIANFFGGGKKQ
ncbi:unnamed protein product [Choristocarpus tenellus]